MNQTEINNIDDNDIEEWFDAEDDPDDSFDSKVQMTPEEKYASSQLQVIRTSMDFTLHHLKQSLDDREYINTAPKYQRRHRWDIKKRSQLIESFLMNIPVPSVFLFENDYNQYEIMDGRQRIDTLRSFMNNEFALKNLEFWKELDGLRFNQLPSVIQRGLSRRTINAVVLLAESTKQEKDGVDIRKILFKRLNTGGVQLNPQELRNALYPGRFIELVSELSRYNTFTKIWKIPQFKTNEDVEPDTQLLNNSLYKTMADCELVVRFFAINRLINEGLVGSLKSILDKTCKVYQNIDELTASELKKAFKESIDGLYEIFGKNCFIVPATKKISRPLYDAMMVAYYSIDDKSNLDNASSIHAKLEKIDVNTPEYEIITGKGNTVESIKERVNLAKSILSCN